MYPPKNPDNMMSIVKICHVTQADVYMYGTVYSVIETGQRKTTTPKDNSSFSQEKMKNCLRWDSNPRHSAY